MRGIDGNRDERELLPKPVGRSDWEDIAQHDYCVDKTLFIRDLIDARVGTALFTRPRRFGKTTAMRMLKCFFEKRGPDEPDVRPLFERRAIGNIPNAAKYLERQGKYPVIYLTFKDHKSLHWEEALGQLAFDIADEFKRHFECMESLPLDKEREDFMSICEMRASAATLENSLGFLSHALRRHYGEKVVVLIDEYDTPVNTASANGYYEEMVAFMRSFLPRALKDNVDVEMGVMTGVLRVAKEGMLSGLNNLRVYTVFDEHFGEYFGFTPDEVAEMARYYGREDKLPEIRDWYDGYVFGGHELYNPWSVLYYFDVGCKPGLYWLDTSSNDIIAEMVRDLPFDIEGKLLSLLKGEAAVVPMAVELGPYQDIRKKPETIYALLVSAGYLKPASAVSAGMCRVAIPNREVEHVYATDICEKFTAQSGYSEDMMEVRVAFSERDPERFRRHVERFLVESASYLDTSAESFYHGLVLGMLSFMRGIYVITSNRESGYGRFDVMLKPRQDHREFPAVVIEVKAAKDDADDLAALAAEARRQIDEKGYAISLEAEGITDILKFGYAFRGKSGEIAK